MPLVYHFLQWAGALSDRGHNFFLEEILDKVLMHEIDRVVVVAHVTLISDLLNAYLVELSIADYYFPGRNLLLLVA